MYISGIDGNWIAEIPQEVITKSGTYKNRIIRNLFVFNQNTTYNRDKLKEATKEEIAHLKACIAANKYIPYTEGMLLNHYEIY